MNHPFSIFASVLLAMLGAPHAADSKPSVLPVADAGERRPPAKGATLRVADFGYGFNKANLTVQVVAAKDKSASTYGQIAANRVGNITFETLDFFGSVNGGIRVSDMHGDVTLRQVRVIRKPGTRHLLSTPSDALHLMNIRGKLRIEDCSIEAPGDDCLNFTYSMGESARLRGIGVSGNTIAGFQGSGIIIANAYRDRQGILDARDFTIRGNVFEVGPAKFIRIRGVRNLRMEGNRFERDGNPLKRADFVEISDCADFEIKE